jgi:signal transduction histidine kinase
MPQIAATKRVKKFLFGKTAVAAQAGQSDGLSSARRSFPLRSDDRLTTERRLELAELELRQARKMAALGELVSTTTHEFNNVLTTIINYAKLGMRHKDEASRDKALTKILAAAQRAEKITNSVLGLARSRGSDRAAIDLAKLVDGSLALLEREMQKYRVQLEIDFQPAPPAFICAGEIQQVLLNLLTNARQAMPNGGRIILRIAHDASSATVDLTVRDTGCGIPQERLPRIFDRFYTTKQGPDASGKGGSGVGLSMCREIIEAHQGRIRVESTVGVGTAFTLKLPVAAKGPETPALATKLGLPIDATVLPAAQQFQMG